MARRRRPSRPWRAGQPGRPWRAGEPAVHRVTFWLTAREFREVEEIATANGRKVNDFARKSLMAHLASYAELTPSDDDVLLDELPARKFKARVLR
jgi:hypothetical protein